MAENQSQLDGFTSCYPTALTSEICILQLSAVKVGNGKVTRMGDSNNTDLFDRKRLASTLTATEQIRSGIGLGVRFIASRLPVQFVFHRYRGPANGGSN